jgi:hypothetical protein
MVFNATSNNISVIQGGGHFYWWKKPENTEKSKSKSLIGRGQYYEKQCSTIPPISK